MSNITIRGIGVTVTPALETAVHKAADSVTRMHDCNSDIYVRLKVEGKHNHKVEVATKCKGKDVRVERVSGDMYATINDAFKVLERKLAKYHDKATERRRGGSIKFAADEPEMEIPSENEFEIVARKAFAVKPMTAEDACMEMERLDHNFYVFISADSGETEVVYKRNDGKFGLITVERDA